MSDVYMKEFPFVSTITVKTEVLEFNLICSVCTQVEIISV